MVKFMLFVAIPLGALVTAFCWRISQLLSPDAIAMAIGLAFGVLAVLPTAALILVASRRGDEYHDAGTDYIDVQPTYRDEVTGATHLFRRAAGLPALPDRQATIAELEAYLDHLKSQRVTP